ncbi:hypothetical protein [Vreelandella stevensii]|uniref:hypothetical protein n=1 Tax=Vreelandella stevensii TaxID=502821 RepID=UPI003747FB88
MAIAYSLMLLIFVLTGVLILRKTHARLGRRKTTFSFIAMTVATALYSDTLHKETFFEKSAGSVSLAILAMIVSITGFIFVDRKFSESKKSL